jgi:O-succinylbenzoic acid--CoA ligase
VAEALLIDWESLESHVLLNPRMPVSERRRLESYVTPLPGHLWLATSGTTAALKMTALSKDAMLASAAAVNRRFESVGSDVWCCVLPTFHVGGLGIYARAHLSGAKVVSMRWDAVAFASRTDITLASLVPAQVHDLVAGRFRSRGNVRAIVVGGGALSAESYAAATGLGWPVLPSYGMTETCSQIATANVGIPSLELLDHAEAMAGPDGRLRVKSSSLLTGYGTEEGFLDPKQDGWFLTSDIGEVVGRRLRIDGRAGEFVKIGGESVQLARLDAILEPIAGRHAAVVALPDRRLGHVIVLVVERPLEAARIESEFNSAVMPFERARRVVNVEAIPRTELGKLRREQLAGELSRIVE